MRKLFILLLALSLVGCALFDGIRKGKTYTTESGLEYQFEKVGKGNKPQPKDMVYVQYTGTLNDGTKFDSSYDRDSVPIKFKAGTGMVIKGWDEILSLMPEGSKVNVTIPPDLAYGERAMGKIPANATLNFFIHLERVVGPPKPFEVEGQDTIKLESGLKYIVVESNQGVPAEAFKQVTVHYTGFTTAGEVFDSSVERESPFSFELGRKRVIAGWDEGVAMMKTGEKFRFIIPPHLAYGSRRVSDLIGPNSTLIFDVELLEVE